MSGKRYCILGGGGSFGINTALYLLEHAHPAKVVGIGRAPLRPEPFSLGIERRERYEYKAFHVGSELDLLLAYLDELRPGVIINFAAQGEGAASWKHSWRFFDTNATALCRLYEELSARQWFNMPIDVHGGRGRFIQIGTSELYGSVDKPATEDFPIKPSSPYSASKAAFDLYLMSMAQAGRGAPMTIIRPSNAYCPGQLLHRIIPRAIVAGLTGRKVPLHGGGQAKKSYLHIRDVARAVYLASEAPVAVGKVYNVGPMMPNSIADVARMCAKAIGVPFDDLFDVAPERLGQDSQYWLDSSAAARDLSWAPKIGWEDGLAEMVVWASRHINQLRDWPTDYQLRA